MKRIKRGVLISGHAWRQNFHSKDSLNSDCPPRPMRVFVCEFNIFCIKRKAPTVVGAFQKSDEPRVRQTASSSRRGAPDTRRKPALKLQILYDVEIPVKCLFPCIRKEQADDGMAIV